MNNGLAEIIPLDYTNEKHVRAAARLHATLLPDSWISQLGAEFMERFYYRTLIKEKKIYCNLFRHLGNYAGFISYTETPASFMKEAGRRHFFYLNLLLIKLIFKDPRRITTLLEMIQYGRKKSSQIENKTVELLSFGVLPDFLKLKDHRNLRISHLLFEHTIAHLKNKGFKQALMDVQKHNKPMLLFYASYGASIKKTIYKNSYQLLLKLN